MRIILPLPLSRANARWHHMTEVRHKHTYYDACLTRYSKPPKKTFARAKITVRFYVHQKNDRDGLWARLKWPLDWLVLREYIVDDNEEVLEWGPVTQEVDRKNMRVEIELEEIDV